MGVKISDMAAADALTGTELLEVTQSGNTRRTTAQDIADLAAGGSGTGFVKSAPSDGSYNFTLPATIFSCVAPANSLVEAGDNTPVLIIEGAFQMGSLAAESVVTVSVQDASSNVGAQAQIKGDVTYPFNTSFCNFFFKAMIRHKAAGESNFSLEVTCRRAGGSSPTQPGAVDVNLNTNTDAQTGDPTTPLTYNVKVSVNTGSPGVALQNALARIVAP